MAVSKKRKGSRKYDPNRWLNRAIAENERRMDAKPLTETRQNEIALGHHLSFEALLRCPDDAQWYDLCGNLNMCLVLAEMGHGSEYIDEIKAAMVGMMRARYRADRTGSLALDADAIKAIRTVLELHDEQLRVVDRSELRKAARSIVARVENGDMYAEHLEAA
ncbi:hypothetical protein G3N95_29925 [Paraburkholderia sp. Tr-20389]|uniref:hypothetical protein n=1 Tax=Paraburkholderia sp. Tr-20389 TaxID=2703903 RepID=UPI001981F423|nr:hypothetical protein [Paraburkholderia sp. Tr-20389]MBN3757193.1 hypothetical protein [Paraburkholderia sp. Tr-20389]